MKTKYTSNQLTKTLGFNLRSTRIKNKTRVADLADFCGLSAQAIYNYENGLCLPSKNSANRLREFFGVAAPKTVKTANKDTKAALTTSRRTITLRGTSTKTKAAK